MDLSPYAERLRRTHDGKLDDLAAGPADGEGVRPLRHVIFADQFSRGLLERLGRLADAIRASSQDAELARGLNDLLRHKRAMLYFTQPSTRTFLSFTAACQVLGIATNEVRDNRLSSEAKGESPFDSMRMFGSYFDVVVMRSPYADFAEACAYLMNDVGVQTGRTVPIVNAGSGADEHPTQALLDIYTVDKFFSETRNADARAIDGKVFGFCGDIGRGRTIRSLASLLAKYRGMTMHFIAADDPALRLDDALRGKLVDAGVAVLEHDGLDATHGGVPVLAQLDCLYMTRIQKEHDADAGAAGRREADAAMQRFKLTPARVAGMRRDAAILHPFPRDEAYGEIPFAVDADDRARYFQQARNGMWARAALLAHLFGVEDAVHALAGGGSGSVG